MDVLLMKKWPFSRFKYYSAWYEIQAEIQGDNDCSTRSYIASCEVHGNANE